MGWEPGVLGLRGLLVAAPWDGRLRFVANVRTGFTDQDRRCLPAVLAGRGRTRPVVRCPHRGLWEKRLKKGRRRFRACYSAASPFE